MQTLTSMFAAAVAAHPGRPGLLTLLDPRREDERTYLTFAYVIWIEGKDKPALVAEQSSSPTPDPRCGR